MKKTLFSLHCPGRWHGKAVTDEVSSSNENEKTDLIHRHREPPKLVILASGNPERSPFPHREGSRRGFTIVELVIALSVIVIVSGISIGVVAVNNKTYGETIDMIEATNIAENAIECFRYAVNNVGDTKTVFESSFNKALGRDENTEFSPETEDDKLVYTVQKDDLVVKIILSDTLSIGNINGALDTITIEAHNSNDDNLFEDTVTYTVR